MTVRLRALVGALLLIAPAQAQQPTFTTRVEGVRVDVLVADNGRPVTGLQASDFELFDNGVSQKIEVVDVERVPLDLVFAFDTSASLAGTRLGQLKSAGDVLLNDLKDEDRVALITFNYAVRQRSPLTTARDTVRATLEAVKAEGGTAL